MLDESKTQPFHIPAKADKFEFDAEVTAIFPNMARRSIPNYEAFHRLHAEIVARWFIADRDEVRILDVGASHGAFFAALNDFYDRNPDEHLPRMRLTAIDNSPEMCRHLLQNFPHADVICEAIDTPEFMCRPDEQYHVINCTYVIQFIAPGRQAAVLEKLSRMLKPGGLLILGQKDKHLGGTGHMLQQQYLRWRMDNGYTWEEIEAKTAALRNSMWPMAMADLKSELYKHFREVSETTRMFMFSTLIAYK